MGSTNRNEGLASSGVSVIVRRVWRRKQSIEDRAFGALNRRVDRRVTVSVGSAFLIWSMGAITVDVHVRSDFYDVVAQMLPVLLLVGAVNGRYFQGLNAKEPFDRFFLRGFWVGGVVGEVAALVVVARGHDSIVLRGCVIYGLLLCGIIATVYALEGPARAHPRPPGPPVGVADEQATLHKQ
jgi:peptidoglycan/LPS O-acetylase OafA/YrhL